MLNYDQWQWSYLTVSVKVRSAELSLILLSFLPPPHHLYMNIYLSMFRAVPRIPGVAATVTSADGNIRTAGRPQPASGRFLNKALRVWIRGHTGQVAKLHDFKRNYFLYHLMAQETSQTTSNIVTVSGGRGKIFILGPNQINRSINPESHLHY